MTTEQRATELLIRWIAAKDRERELRRQRNRELSLEDNPDPATAPSQTAFLAARKDKDHAVRALRQFARNLRDQSNANEQESDLIPPLGANLARLRRERKWTFKDMSERTGIAISYIHKLEHGKQRNPSLRHITTLARAFDVTLSELTGQPATREDA